MEAPPNFGADYTADFAASIRRWREYDVRLIPFLLDGVAGNAALNQADGIHPNARGARWWPTWCGAGAARSPELPPVDLKAS